MAKYMLLNTFSGYISLRRLCLLYLQIAKTIKIILTIIPHNDSFRWRLLVFMGCIRTKSSKR